MSVLNADKVLDCSGLLCPMPVVRVSKGIKEVSVGQVLKMISTDPGSLSDMQALAKQTGQQLLDSHREDTKYIFYIKRVK